MTATAASSPWLRPTASQDALEDDLRARGWSVRWQTGGELKIASPDGTFRRTIDEKTSARTMRFAYAAAQEHEGAALRESLFPPRLTCPGCGQTTCAWEPQCGDLHR